MEQEYLHIRYVQWSRKGKYTCLSRKRYYCSGAESERTYNGARRESTSSEAGVRTGEQEIWVCTLYSILEQEETVHPVEQEYAQGSKKYEYVQYNGAGRESKSSGAGYWENVQWNWTRDYVQEARECMTCPLYLMMTAMRTGTQCVTCPVISKTITDKHRNWFKQGQSLNRDMFKM